MQTQMYSADKMGYDYWCSEAQVAWRCFFPSKEKSFRRALENRRGFLQSNAPPQGVSCCVANAPFQLSVLHATISIHSFCHTLMYHLSCLHRSSYIYHHCCVSCLPISVPLRTTQSSPYRLDEPCSTFFCFGLQHQSRGILCYSLACVFSLRESDSGLLFHASMVLHAMPVGDPGIFSCLFKSPGIPKASGVKNYSLQLFMLEKVIAAFLSLPGKIQSGYSALSCHSHYLSLPVTICLSPHGMNLGVAKITVAVS